MAEIHALPGVTKPDSPLGHQPNADVLEMLRVYLAEAERGEIQGIGVAIARPDGVTGFGFSGAAVANELGAAIIDLMHEFALMRSDTREKK